MKKLWLVLLLTSISIFDSLSQNNEAQAFQKFKEGRKAFQAENYSSAASNLLETKRLLGEGNIRILPMLIKSLDKIQNWPQAKVEISDYYGLGPDPSLVEYREIQTIQKRVESKISLDHSTFRSAKNSGNISQLNSYLSKFPYAIHKSEINDLKDDFDFDIATENRTTAAYYEYLNKYPYGRHSSEARSTIERWDQEAYDKARNTNTVSGFNYYLSNYPKGNYRSDARNEITRLNREADVKAYNTARYSNTISSFKNYLYNYPRGNYRGEANAAIAKLERKARVAKKAKDFFLGNDDTNVAVYVEKIDGGNNYQLSMLLSTYSPFGFGYGAFTYYDEDPYIQGGWAFLDLQAYISVNGGKGIFGVVGYQPGFNYITSSEDYFFDNTRPPGSSFVIQSYEPEDLEFSITRLHYGLGYQNSFGNLFIGVSYEWFQKTYKADEQDRISFPGAEFTVEGQAANFRLGLSF